MLELELALERILAAMPGPRSEVVPLEAAFHRVLSDTIHSTVDLPLFDNSAMDGYAVRAADVAGANEKSAARLRLEGKVAAGEWFPGEVTAGGCVRLFTGSPLPRGADAVVMQEDTNVEAANPGEILVTATAKPWENVRLRGEDVKKGVVLVEKGHRLTVSQMSLLAAVGQPQIDAGCRPVVGVVATGSELREPGQSLAPGQIYENNRIGISALLHSAGAIPIVYPLVADSPEAVQAGLETAFSQCDAVVTSGGVSVGEMDFIKTVFEAVGGELQFWRVAIKPGRPFVFGRYQKKFLFGLPGNPVSALVTFLLLVRPALLRWQGASDVRLPSHPGVLATALANPGPRRHFMRVRVDRDGKVFSAGVQASHMLSSLATANGLVDVPPEVALPAGTAVSVMRWDS